jgi:uncharacterized membrane protein YhaH (DUF805 family)
MGVSENIRAFWDNSWKYSGRASRREFWLGYLSVFLLMLPLAFVLNLLEAEEYQYRSLGHGVRNLVLLQLVVIVVVLLFHLATISAGCRRLHDQDRSGCWLLLGLIPFIGWLVLIVLFCKPGTKGANRFGDDPLEGVTVEAIVHREKTNDSPETDPEKKLSTLKTLLDKGLITKEEAAEARKEILKNM